MRLANCMKKPKKPETETSSFINSIVFNRSRAFVSDFTSSKNFNSIDSVKVTFFVFLKKREEKDESVINSSEKMLKSIKETF